MLKKTEEYALKWAVKSKIVISKIELRIIQNLKVVKSKWVYLNVTNNLNQKIKHKALKNKLQFFFFFLCLSLINR